MQPVRQFGTALLAAIGTNTWFVPASAATECAVPAGCGFGAGAMLIGIVESITATFYGPSWAPAVAFGFLLLTLAVRPAGILGR